MKGSILRPVALLAGASLVGTGLAMPAFAEDTIPSGSDSSTTESAPLESTPSEPASQEPETLKSTRDASSSEESTVAPAAPSKETAAEDENSSTPASSTISLLAISDFHGYLGELPRMACQIDSLRAANPGNTMFVSNGDNVGGSAYISAVGDDLPTLDMLNTMGLQVSSVGNHELDRGYADLAGRISDNANFPIIAANLEGVDPTIIPPYYEITADNGIEVAFVGAVTADLPALVGAAGIAGLTVTDPVAAVDKVAAQLKDGNTDNGEADVVVALIHEGFSIAQNVGSDVDVVVAGHSHETALTTTASGAVLVQPGSFGQVLSTVTLEFDAEGNITNKDSANMTMADLGDDACVNATTQEQLEKYQALAEEKGKEVIGTITGKARRGTNYGFESTEPKNENRGTESTAANLIAQGFYEFSKLNGFGADFGIINAGGVRADLDPNADGVITLGESQTTQPFDGDMGTVDLTAAQVFELLEQQWQAPDASRPVLQLGLSDTISYTYDPTAERGNKITSVIINGMLLDREDSTTTFTVIGGTFLLDGGDNFSVLPEGTNRQNLGYKDLAAFNEFLKANKDWPVLTAQRGVGITGPTEVVAGAEVTFNLASLAMTADEPKPETVEIWFEGETLATAAVDTTPVPLYPETGQATVTFTIPEGLETGKYAFEIVADQTYSLLILDVVSKAVSNGSGETTQGTNTSKPDTTGGTTNDKLAKTGVEIWGLTVTGLLLLVAGTGAVALRRRNLI